MAKLAPLITLAGVIVLIVALISYAVWRAGHPTIKVVNQDTNEIVIEKTMPKDQALQLAEKAKIRQIQDVPLEPPKVVVAPPKSQFQTDKQIEITAKVLAGAAAGDLSYVNGTFTNRTGKGLKSVTLTAYVNGQVGAQVTYNIIPSDCCLPYSISLPIDADIASKSEIRVGGAAAPADDKLVIWLADASLLNRRVDGDTVTWTGELRNPSKWPLRNIQLICDFFQDDGSQGGSAEGGLLSSNTLASQGKDQLLITTNQTSAQAAVTFVVRAAGEKY
jgi:hypothetical protein